jgi:ubiquinone/menaquinone biosynthesis C-methylase UbiE
MGDGARTPEELESLLEDALVLRDGEALAGLFEAGAVLVAGGQRPARGGAAIARLALATWAGDRTYVADPRRVLQARDLALIVAEGAINVARRGGDGAWRYAMSFLSGGETMGEPGYAAAVGAHYTAGDLGAQILASLRAAGKDPEALQVEDLAQIDQFHAGGAQATRALIRRACLRPGMRVLDVGGGLGGPARLLAHDAGCAVTVLELSEESCRVGELLTARVGLAGRVTFRHGNALEMPFPDGAFDVVWTQHATMNIAEKERLYREISRVLRPGGRLAMQEVMAGPVQPIHFPVPWARDASISFLWPAAEIRALLAEIGFREAEWVDEREAVLAYLQAVASGQPQPGSPVPAAQLMLGPQLPEMQRNVGRNLREDRLTHVQAVFERR